MQIEIKTILVISLATTIGKDTVGNVQDVVAARESRGHVGLLMDYTVEFAKGGQRSCTHPHNEVFVDEAIVLLIQWVQFVHRLPPVHRFVGA